MPGASGFGNWPKQFVNQNSDANDNQVGSPPSKPTSSAPVYIQSYTPNFVPPNKLKRPPPGSDTANEGSQPPPETHKKPKNQKHDSRKADDESHRMEGRPPSPPSPTPGCFNASRHYGTPGHQRLGAGKDYKPRYRTEMGHNKYGIRPADRTASTRIHRGWNGHGPPYGPKGFQTHVPYGRAPFQYTRGAGCCAAHMRPLWALLLGLLVVAALAGAIAGIVLGVRAANSPAPVVDPYGQIRYYQLNGVYQACIDRYATTTPTTTTTTPTTTTQTTTTTTAPTTQEPTTTVCFEITTEPETTTTPTTTTTVATTTPETTLEVTTIEMTTVCIPITISTEATTTTPETSTTAADEVTPDTATAGVLTTDVATTGETTTTPTTESTTTMETTTICLYITVPMTNLQETTTTEATTVPETTTMPETTTTLATTTVLETTTICVWTTAEPVTTVPVTTTTEPTTTSTSTPTTTTTMGTTLPYCDTLTTSYSLVTVAPLPSKSVSIATSSTLRVICACVSCTILTRLRPHHY